MTIIQTSCNQMNKSCRDKGITGNVIATNFISTKAAVINKANKCLEHKLLKLKPILS